MNISHSDIFGFYHPTKIIFLDDNKGYLDALSLEFFEYKNIDMITDPNIAMQIINKSKKNLLQSVIETKEEENPHECFSGIYINNLATMIYDKSRFDTVSILIIDYEMPEINGLEFCKQITDKNIYKVLLTAEADSTIAITAFNDGHINKFIQKDMPNLPYELSKIIIELTNKYFMKASQLIFQSCGTKLEKIFNNDQYKVLFNSIKHQSNSIEYYLIDRNGSFLFLNETGKPTWLIISDQEKAHEQAELLKGYNFPETRIRKIQNGEDILFLFSEYEYQEPIDKWEQYIFKAEKISDYSYCVVKDKIINSIEWI